QGDYKKVLSDNDQKIGGTGMSSKVDTFDIFMYPERSQLDQAYVQALKGEVGEEFVRDVLFVDFTRPIYSPTRCGLLEAVDSSADLDTIVKAAVSKKLPGADELSKSHASTEKGASRHQNEVNAYMTACAGRSGAAFAADVVKYASHLRRAARQLRV